MRFTNAKTLLWQDLTDVIHAASKEEGVLSRRTLIGSMAVLAAGCGGLEFSLPSLGIPQEVPLSWVSRAVPNLKTGPSFSLPEERLQWIVGKLEDEPETL